MTTPTGIPIAVCDQCGHRHPIGRPHCPNCGLAHLFPRRGCTSGLVKGQSLSQLEGSQ